MTQQKYERRGLTTTVECTFQSVTVYQIRLSQTLPVLLPYIHSYTPTRSISWHTHWAYADNSVILLLKTLLLIWLDAAQKLLTVKSVYCVYSCENVLFYTVNIYEAVENEPTVQFVSTLHYMYTARVVGIWLSYITSEKLLGAPLEEHIICALGDIDFQN
jgi:hypothetical protein